MINIKKKIKAIVFCIAFFVLAIAAINISTFAQNVTIIPGIPEVDANTTSTHKYSSYWQYWSQGASGYSGMRSSGCRVVAYSKLLAELGMSPGNPDAFYNYMLNNSYITSGMSETGEVSDLGRAPVAYATANGKTLSCVARPNISGSNASNVSTVMNYINQGYYVVLMSTAHTVYVGRQASLDKGTPVILDSFTGKSSSPYLPQTKVRSRLICVICSGNSYNRCRIQFPE